MNIQTKHEVDIYCLPESALCIETFEHPNNMKRCPLHQFDDFGDICVPELCESYDEYGGGDEA